MSKNVKEILAMVLLTGAALLVFSWFMDQKDGPITDPINPLWDEAGFDFATSTPEIDLMAEGGWWDEMATKKPSALPAMPEMDLLKATATPLPATETALALTPHPTSTLPLTEDQ